MTGKPEINVDVEIKNEPKPDGGGYLNDIVGDMPQVSPAANVIAEKVLNEKKEQNPNNSLPSPDAPKKRGRPKGAATSQKSTLGGVANAGQRDSLALERQQDAERVAAATFIVGAVEVSGVAIGGKGAAMPEGEKFTMIAVWDKYLKSKNINDIPAGMAVALTMSQYFGRVLMQPEAKPKVEKFASKIVKKFKGWKNARFGSGYDGERENNAGEADDKSLSARGDKMSGFRPVE